MNTTSCLGRRLLACRLGAGISQEELGGAVGLAAGVARTRMSRYESGCHHPSFSMAKSLADFFNVPVAYFYCEDDTLAEVIRHISKLPKGSLVDLLEQFNRSSLTKG